MDNLEVAAQIESTIYDLRCKIVVSLRPYLPYYYKPKTSHSGTRSAAECIRNL